MGPTFHSRADPNCLAVSVKVGGTAAMSHDIASKLFQMGGPDVDMDTRINASSQSLQVAGQGEIVTILLCLP